MGEEKPNKLSNNQIRGYAMAGIGFVMILGSAASYLFGWDFKSPAFSALGIIFVLIGLKTGRDNSNSKKGGV